MGKDSGCRLDHASIQNANLMDYFERCKDNYLMWAVLYVGAQASMDRLWI